MEMKKNKTIKKILTTVIISTAILNADYVEDPEIKTDDSDETNITINTSAKEQTFDEAFLIGLQLLDQSNETNGYGKIVINFKKEKYTAVVSLNALKKYDEKKVDYASFIRNNIKFI